MKTYSAKAAEINKKWIVIDASNVILGRLAAKVALILRGKDKPDYTPHMDCGNNVIIINAEHIALTGHKYDLKDGKMYYRHTGFPGGIKSTTAGKMLERGQPEKIIRLAIKRMLPKNILGNKQLSNLYVYKGEDHPHAAQTPILYDFAAQNSKNIQRKK